MDNGSIYTLWTKPGFRVAVYIICILIKTVGGRAPCRDICVFNVHVCVCMLKAVNCCWDSPGAGGFDVRGGIALSCLPLLDQPVFSLFLFCVQLFICSYSFLCTVFDDAFRVAWAMSCNTRACALRLNVPAPLLALPLPNVRCHGYPRGEFKSENPGFDPVAGQGKE